MRVPRPVVVLRLACLAGLVAAALLTADALRPDRRFCPLAAACDRAAASALGKILGVPTSTLGLVAFGGLFVITLLPIRFARRVARPAGFVGAIAGFVFVAYQAFFLRLFCPFCVIADVSALTAGAAAIAWEPQYLYRGKKKPPVESIPARLRWAFAAQLAVAVPLLWPAPPPRPSWTPLPQGATYDVAAAFGATDAPTANSGDARDSAAMDDSIPSAEPFVPTSPAPTERPSEPTGDNAARLPSSLTFAPPRGPAADPIPSFEDSTPSPVSPPKPVPAAAPRPRVPVPVAPPPRREITIVEYLNPFCAHCRATHARLERVLPTIGATVRRHRVYVWPNEEAPFWAGACACAQLHVVGRGRGLRARRRATSGPRSVGAVGVRGPSRGASPHRARPPSCRAVAHRRPADARHRPPPPHG
jgi:uncharacterized membrane protein